MQSSTLVYVLCLCSLAVRGAVGYVDPLIGTSASGHAHPAASYPFGRMQAGPDTGNGSWAYCSGYRYEDRAIEWFSQNHMNGTGRGDMGDLGLMPFVSEDPGLSTPKVVYRKPTETARPGYYAVTLDKDDVRVEATVSPRCSIWRFSYPDAEPMRLLVDVRHGLTAEPDIASNPVDWSSVRLGKDCRSISGRLRTKRWTERLCAFQIAFDRPWRKVDTRWPDPALAPRYCLDFGAGGQLMAKVSISVVDEAGARANLEREIAGWDFDAVRESAERAWEDVLGRMEVEGDEAAKRSLFTALYRLCLQPHDITDCDGRYRGADDLVHVSETGNHYSTFSLWDTFRAAHPLYTVLFPERVDAFVNSMLRHFDERGYLPIWPVWGKESHCMIANHAVPVIVDAYLKGFSGFDAERAYRAVKVSLTKSDARRIKDFAAPFAKYGYLPYDEVTRESVSSTLEMCYDEICAARFAEGLGKKSEAEEFRRRAGNWRNLLDPETGFMRPRDSDGAWKTPFDPAEVPPWETTPYTEGNAWQYTWHVLHDAEGLAEALGGRQAARRKLEELFVRGFSTDVNRDITGLIGQYAHGNEPSHHIPYLFALWGDPDRTAEIVGHVCREFYRPTPDGLCGNDDCGQMGAWYLFSSMGLYPVDPCGGGYVLGAPQVSRITLRLQNGKAFTVFARGISETKRYVKSVSLNGRCVQGVSIGHSDIMNGGTLEFEMEGREREKTDL